MPTKSLQGLVIKGAIPLQVLHLHVWNLVKNPNNYIYGNQYIAIRKGRTPDYMLCLELNVAVLKSKFLYFLYLKQHPFNHLFDIYKIVFPNGSRSRELSVIVKKLIFF